MNEGIKRAWLSPKEAAKYLGVSEQSLALWRMKGMPPKFSKPVGKIYYFIEDLDAFLRGDHSNFKQIGDIAQNIIDGLKGE